MPFSKNTYLSTYSSKSYNVSNIFSTVDKLISIYKSSLSLKIWITASLVLYQLGNPALPRLLKVTPAVYPHDFNGKLNFAIKVDQPNLEY